MAVSRAWRLILRPFRIKPAKMRWDRLGMRLADRDDQHRVETVCEVVAGGFNHMLCGGDDESWYAYGESLEPHYRPFAREGAAMGYTLRHTFGSGRGCFEQNVVKAHPEGTYLYYVGRGLYHGVRFGKPDRLHREAGQLDSMYGMLSYDGFGFHFGFFDYGRIREHAAKLLRLDGYRSRAAMQGVGRALWFHFMRDADRLVEEIRSFEPGAREDLAGGLGLASTFVHTDRMESVWELASRMPEEWRPHFQLGMCFALRAREMNGQEYFAECLARMPDGKRDGIRASLRACDRIEREIRAGGEPDGYRLWRERLTAWMNENLRYPLETAAEKIEAA